MKQGYDAKAQRRREGFFRVLNPELLLSASLVRQAKLGHSS